MSAHLPIDEHLPRITSLLATSPSLVIQAPPGAGKSTRIPPALLGSTAVKDGTILLLEPRRVAARSLAGAMASFIDEKVGQTVGYRIRFENVSSPQTKILVITEGILTRRMLTDPFLEDVSCVILDEFHERSVHTDLALAFTREVQRVREDLKLVVMSATMDARRVSEYLDDCPVVTASCREHPLEVEHVTTDDDRPLPMKMASGVIATSKKHDGDILAFLPGRRDILATKDLLEKSRGDGSLEITTLHGGASGRDQDAALLPSSRRKVILATNIAQTSLTIPNVTCVVDSGLAKQLRWDQRTGLDALALRPISLADADQRAGRAGRTGPGYALRLWTKARHTGLSREEIPQILRVDPAPTLLAVMAVHPGDPRRFPFFDAPRESALEAGLALLDKLGALESNRSSLTKLGALLADLPAHPRIGAILATAAEADRKRAALIAAILSEPDFLLPDFFRNGEFPFEHECDLEHRVELIEGFSENGRRPDDARRLSISHSKAHAVIKTAKQLENLSSRRIPKKKLASREISKAPCGALALAGYPDRICVRDPKDPRRATMPGGGAVRISPRSGARKGDLFLALRSERGVSPKAGGKTGAVDLAAHIIAADLERVFPGHLEERTEAVFLPERGRVIGVTRRYYDDLVLSEKPGAKVPSEEKRAVLATAARERFDSLFKPDEETSDLIHRLAFARVHLTNLNWPEVEREDLLEMLDGLCAGLSSLDEVARIDWKSAILGAMDFEARRALDTHLPERLRVPSGSSIRLDYSGGPQKSPVLAVKLQEMFGLKETPTVAMGKIPVLLHLLAPNRRPVQITDDLSSFWTNTYPQVKKVLKGRYPKHPWPEDPLSAEATARTKRRRP